MYIVRFLSFGGNTVPAVRRVTDTDRAYDPYGWPEERPAASEDVEGAQKIVSGKPKLKVPN